MTEIIESIDTSYGASEYDDQYGYTDEYKGVKIVTSEQEILFLIQTGQFCCETSGYLTSIENPQEFIGAELFSITETDSSLHTKEIESLKEAGVNPDYEDANIFFITVKTSKGDLQFTIYNEHNGYYGHDVIIKSTQLSRNFSL